LLAADDRRKSVPETHAEEEARGGAGFQKRFGNGATETAGDRVFLDGDDPPSFPRSGAQGFDVQGLNRVDTKYPSLNTFRGENAGGPQGFPEDASGSSESHILPLADDAYAAGHEDFIRQIGGRCIGFIEAQVRGSAVVNQES
jgi:hypothetical protein